MLNRNVSNQQSIMGDEWNNMWWTLELPAAEKNADPKVRLTTNVDPPDMQPAGLHEQPSCGE